MNSKAEGYLLLAAIVGIVWFVAASHRNRAEISRRGSGMALDGAALGVRAIRAATKKLRHIRAEVRQRANER